MKRSIFVTIALCLAAIFAPVSVSAQYVSLYGTQVRNAGGAPLASGQFCVQPVDGSNHPIIANVSAYSTTGTFTSGVTSITTTGTNGSWVQIGQAVSGPGIPAGTVLTSAAGGAGSMVIGISQATTASGTAARIVLGGGAVVTGPSCTAITNGIFGTPNSYQLAAFSVPDTSVSNPQNLCLRATITDSNQNGKAIYTAPCVQPAPSASWCYMVNTSGSYTCNYDLYSPPLAPLVLQQTGPAGTPGATGATGAGGGAVNLAGGFNNSGAPLTASTICGMAASTGPITSFTLMSDGSTGNATVDITSETLAQFLAGTAATSITNGHPATFTAAKGVNVTSFTGWATFTITAGNVYCFALTSPATITGLSVTVVY